MKVERFMHVLGVFEMEYNHLNFVELECGVGFCNWALDFFYEIVMLENLVLQFKFSSFFVH